MKQDKVDFISRIINKIEDVSKHFNHTFLQCSSYVSLNTLPLIRTSVRFFAITVL